MEFSLLSVFGAGLLTFFSPCVLPMVPIVAANYLMSDNQSQFARLKATILFSLGFLLTFTLMGASLPFISEALGSAKSYLIIASGVLILLYGMKMSGWILKNSDDSKFFSWMSRSKYLPQLDKYFPKSVHGFIFGATFGLAWTPCVGPILGGVLTYIATKERSVTESVLLMLSFGLGVVAPFIAISVGGDLVQNQIKKLRRFLPKIEEFTGFALILLGVYILTQSSFPIGTNDEMNQAQFRNEGGQYTTVAEVAPESHKLLFFHSTHCPVCIAMETYLPEIEKECVSKNFQLIRVNVDDPANQALANKYRVRAVPTISLQAKDGSEIAYSVGYQSEIKLRQAINMLPEVQCAQLEKAMSPSQMIYREGQSCEENGSGNGLTC